MYGICMYAQYGIIISRYKLLTIRSIFLPSEVDGFFLLEADCDELLKDLIGHDVVCVINIAANVIEDCWCD